MRKIRERVLKIIHIGNVFADGIAGGRKWRYPGGVPGVAKAALQKCRQRNRLAAVNADFQKTARFEFAKKQEPHDVERILAKAAALPGEIIAMVAQLLRKQCVKIAKTFLVKTGRITEAPGPIVR